MSESTTAQHTPGPWHVPSEYSDFQVHGPDGIRVADVLTINRHAAECEANAHLIAAAPAMAEALLWIRENLHPKALGRGATDAELLAISLATKVLREAGVIPTPVLEP